MEAQHGLPGDRPMTGIVVTVPVKWDRWLPMMYSFRRAIKERVPMVLSFRCGDVDCHKTHEGIMLCAHPERLEVQVEILH